MGRKKAKSECMIQSGPATSAQTYKEAVLVVDDETPLLEMYKGVLSPYFDVVTASSVKEA